MTALPRGCYNSASNINGTPAPVLQDRNRCNGRHFTVATPQALVRVEGVVLGGRQHDIPARPADPENNYPGGEAYSYREVDVQTSHSRYDGNLAAVPAVTQVIFAVEDTPPPAGTLVDWYVYPYQTSRKTRGGFFRYVALRFVADVPKASAQASRPAA